MASSTHFLPKLHRAPHLALPPRPGATHACSDGPCMIPKRSRRRATLPLTDFLVSSFRCEGLSLCPGRSFRLSLRVGPSSSHHIQGGSDERPHYSRRNGLEQGGERCRSLRDTRREASPVPPAPPVLTWPHLASPPFYKLLCPRRTRSCPPRLARKGRQARRSRRCLVAAVSGRRLAREDFG